MVYLFIYLFIFLSLVWTIKLTESTNSFCFSDRVACTIKQNIKEALMGSDGLLQGFMW